MNLHTSLYYSAFREIENWKIEFLIIQLRQIIYLSLRMWCILFNIQ